MYKRSGSHRSTWTSSGHSSLMMSVKNFSTNKMLQRQ